MVGLGYIYKVINCPRLIDLNKLTAEWKMEQLALGATNQEMAKKQNGGYLIQLNKSGAINTVGLVYIYKSAV